jgi:hypothetical protein
MTTIRRSSRRLNWPPLSKPTLSPLSLASPTFLARHFVLQKAMSFFADQQQRLSSYCCWEAIASHANSSSKALATFKSSVSKPSVNQP